MTFSLAWRYLIKLPKWRWMHHHRSHISQKKRPSCVAPWTSGESYTSLSIQASMGPTPLPFSSEPYVCGRLMAKLITSLVPQSYWCTARFAREIKARTPPSSVKEVYGLPVRQRAGRQGIKIPPRFKIPNNEKLLSHFLPITATSASSS